MTKARADAEAFKGITNVVGQPQGPVKSQDHKAIQTVVQIQKDKKGWEGIGKVVDAMAEVGEENADGLGFHVTGPAGHASDSIKAFSGWRRLLYNDHRVGGGRDPAAHLPQPGAVAAAGLSAGVALVTAEAVIYLLAKHAGLTVNAQSAGILTVLVFGAGTDYALLLVARYREELRRHEDRHEAMAFALHRAGPAIFASAATVVVGMLLPAVRRDELHQGHGPGLRDRHRGRPARDAHPAAGPAGHLRPLDVLAAAARLRLRRADRAAAVGAGRRPHRRPAARGLGRHRRCVLGVAGPRADRAERRPA